MATKIVVDPVTRIEGHLKIEVTVDSVGGEQQVVDARATGTLFRGLEKILVGRDPRDAQQITERICGVCPVSHGMAATKTLDDAFGATVPENARIMRNLVLGANYLQSHVLHFYHLTALDFVDGPNMAPWRPSWKTDHRLDQATNDLLVDHYLQALDIRRKCHEAGAIFGGRLPHPPAYIPGGFTKAPTATDIADFHLYMNELIPFIDNVYIPDVLLVADVYADYFSIGTGHGSLLSYGVFDEDASGSDKLLARGRIASGSGTVLPVDTAQIKEEVISSWYSAPAGGEHPSVGTTEPVYPKEGAYSWLKSPRYSQAPYECGPLARMTVNGDYTGAVSVMDRHKARALEARKVAAAMVRWVDELDPAAPVYDSCSVPAGGTGEGLTEAPRGALGHWLRVESGEIASYQVITPTCWNVSPTDERGGHGPVEQALLGTPVQNEKEPVEVVRVIHSYDPCLSCAVHVMRPDGGSGIVSFEAI